MYNMIALVVISSNVPRQAAQYRHVTKIPPPQLLSFPTLANRDVRNSFRFRSYENCRVWSPFSRSGTHHLLNLVPFPSSILFRFMYLQNAPHPTLFFCYGCILMWGGYPPRPLLRKEATPSP